MKVKIWQQCDWVEQEIEGYVEAGKLSASLSAIVQLYDVNGQYLCWFYRGWVQD